MGACTFQTAGMGKTADDVFMKLYQQAEQEYGTDSYNGKISTCNGFKMVKLPSRANIQKFVDSRIDKIDKRDCECIELSKSGTAQWKKLHGLKGKRGKVFFFFGWAAE